MTFNKGPWHIWIEHGEFHIKDTENNTVAIAYGPHTAAVLKAAWLIPELLDAVGQITQAIGLNDANELANGHESARRVYEKAREHGYVDLSV